MFFAIIIPDSARLVRREPGKLQMQIAESMMLNIERPARLRRQWVQFFADPRASHRIYKQTRKYLKKNRVDKFFKYYTPLLNEFNGDLAGVRVPTGEDDGDDEDRPALEGKLQS
ncbi:hypothetical protein B0H14DRAFT_2652796 [Mycena olivaceomarginata]|nr:hypothetical protein B0H14DRAFT_2652796 [Mycena olivaceomarginata]